MAEEIEHQRKNDADEDGRAEGEVDAEVAAAPGKVSGQLAERDAKATGEQQHQSGDGYQQAHCNQNAA